MPDAQLPDFTRTADGLLPAIAQDAESGEVLMQAFMNAESFAETLATGRAVYYSRSRGKLWRKGEESGHFQEVRQILVDCDGDSILLKIRQQGGVACHTGRRSCYFREITADGVRTISDPLVDPKTLYGKPHD